MHVLNEQLNRALCHSQQHARLTVALKYLYFCLIIGLQFYVSIIFSDKAFLFMVPRAYHTALYRAQPSKEPNLVYPDRFLLSRIARGER